MDYDKIAMAALGAGSVVVAPIVIAAGVGALAGYGLGRMDIWAVPIKTK